MAMCRNALVGCKPGVLDDSALRISGITELPLRTGRQTGLGETPHAIAWQYLTTVVALVQRGSCGKDRLGAHQGWMIMIFRSVAATREVRLGKDLEHPTNLRPNDQRSI